MMEEATSSSQEVEMDEQKTKKQGEEEDMCCVVVLGMAGSGKSTLVKRLTADLYAKKKPPYVVNTDPAVLDVAYPANIDIRDTVDYAQVMKQYNLGPNGAIITCLNLFTTRFDQVANLLQKRKHECQYALFDTPGQIEAFTWSASGAIITETLASLFPTVVVYVMDAARCLRPVTFMSNMLYACSILYKTKLPFVLAINKADLVDPSPIIEWMTDFERFEEALEQEKDYISDLTRSLSLTLDEFYGCLKHAKVSSLTGQGVDGLLEALVDAKREYYKDYRPEYERLLKERDESSVKERARQLERLKLDAAVSGGEAGTSGSGGLPAAGQRVHISLGRQEDEDEDEDEGEGEGEERGFQEEEQENHQKHPKSFKPAYLAGKTTQKAKRDDKE